MKIRLIVVGELQQKHLAEGTAVFEKRLKHYCNFEVLTLRPAKAATASETNAAAEKEGDFILAKLQPGEVMIALDEKGKQLSSAAFAALIANHQNRSVKSLCFVVGGAHGLSQKVLQSASMIMSLSAMTFTHEMARFFFTEQVYRAMTILKNEKYHHN